MLFRSQEAPQKTVHQDSAEPETLSLDQIIYDRSDMIVEPAVRKPAPPKPPPAKKMSQMATELAGMISDINGNQKR